jgi:hypothetical protein
MNAVRSVGAALAERMSADPTCRREVFFWLSATIVANQLLRIHGDTPALLMEEFGTLAIGKGVFYFLGWYAVFHLLNQSSAAGRAPARDIAFALVATLVNFIDAQSSAWLSATAAGLYLLRTSQNDGKMAAAASVVLALAFNGFWGPLFFDTFAFYLLRADAAIVGGLLSTTQPGISWQDTIVGDPNGHRLLIFGPCSSFHNISMGLLCLVTMTKLERTAWIKGDLGVALLVCATVIVLNTCRLYLLALGPDLFKF